MEESKKIVEHPIHGVNGHLAYCPACERDSGELIFLGITNTVWACPICNQKMLCDEEPKMDCPTCGGKTYRPDHELEKGEKIPGSLCSECQKKLDHQEELVKAGGVYFRCTNCHQHGIVTDEDVCKEVRKEVQVPEGPIGIEIAMCPLCVNLPKENGDAPN
jgi:hypothetical protein